MASRTRGLTHKSGSLGSFVEVETASGSEFEPVELEEDMGSQANRRAVEKPGLILGKNSTPPPVAVGAVQQESDIARIHDVEGFSEPLQDGFQTLENATQKAAELAKEFTNKLFTNSAAEARSSVLKLAGDVSSWWAALDPVSKPAQLSPDEAASQAAGEVQDLFGLPESEDLLENFECTLIQTMECQHNNFSMPQQVRCPGKLYITNKNACFVAEGVRFALMHSRVNNAVKLEGAVYLHFEGGHYVAFDGFRPSEAESALGLIEHLTE